MPGRGQGGASTIALVGDVRQPPGGGGPANPGWYSDPWGQSAWRWWDGWQWSGWLSPPVSAPYHVVAQAVSQAVQHPATGPAPVENPPPAAPYSPPSALLPPSGVYGAYPGQPPAAYPYPPLMATERPLAAPPATPVPAKQRRRVVAELLIVLAVFPLQYSITAVVVLVSDLLGNGSGRRTTPIIKGHAAASFPFDLLLILLPLAAAALVWYLLSVPGLFGNESQAKGEGGLRAIGLDKTNLRGDLALVIAVFVFCELIPIYGGALVLHGLHVHSIAPGTGGVPKYYVVLNVLDGFTAGIVEEIVVLGFLVRRLEQLNLPSWAVVVIAVAVRGSYHLYYGWGVLPILLWATVTVILYRRWRRLAPFIIVHMLWDSSLFIAASMNTHDAGLFLLAEAGVLIPLTFVIFLVWKNHVPLPIAARSQ